ncbi:MAG TPA: hypothetical protein VFJ85_08625 [Acidimicrobiales bacterium]|nr:hypothetical protein [Acidimicrobiales bacterium]
MFQRLRATVALAGAALVALAVGPAFACGAAPSQLRVAPVTGVSGTTVTASGSYFPSAQVELHWGSRAGPLLATAMGPNFSAAFTVPDAAPGYYAVVAVQSGDPSTAAATFSVTQPDPTTTTTTTTTTVATTTTTATTPPSTVAQGDPPVASHAEPAAAAAVALPVAPAAVPASTGKAAPGVDSQAVVRPAPAAPATSTTTASTSAPPAPPPAAVAETPVTPPDSAPPATTRSLALAGRPASSSQGAGSSSVAWFARLAVLAALAAGATLAVLRRRRAGP